MCTIPQEVLQEVQDRVTVLTTEKELLDKSLVSYKANFAEMTEQLTSLYEEEKEYARVKVIIFKFGV
jgi:two-component sensor histidine kinase